MTDNMTPTIDITDPWGEEQGTFRCTPLVCRYTNGRLALELLYFDEELGTYFPHSKVTVNIPDAHLNEGEFLVKDWSENEPVVAALLEAGWLESTGREVASGFVFPKVMRPAGPLADFISEQERY